MVNLSRLEEIKDLRTVWPHEALDFTPWLSQDDNISLLADAIGLDIIVDETESSVGDFNVDIFASETGTDRKIIIENQLEDTNHDHLGKLITYASGKSADVIVWVVKHAREEHKAAIEWLNNHTDEKIGFFLCEIKLYRIGTSEPAVKFEVIEKPNDWTKEVKKNKGSKKERVCKWDSAAEIRLLGGIPGLRFPKRTVCKELQSQEAVYGSLDELQRRFFCLPHRCVADSEKKRAGR